MDGLGVTHVLHADEKGERCVTTHEFFLDQAESSVLVEYEADASTSAMGGKDRRWYEHVHELHHAVLLCTADCEWTVMAMFRITGPEEPNAVLGPDTKVRGPALLTCTRDDDYYVLDDSELPELYRNLNAAAAS